MNMSTVLLNTIAILEMLFFVLTMYYLMTGLRTKDYNPLKKYGVAYILINFVRRIVEYTQKKAMTVSIIGGADGPTSIFLAGKVGATVFWGVYVLGFVAVLFVVGIIVYIKKKK